MTDKPAQRYLAMELAFPGTWGASPDGFHQAIAFACDEGADRGSVFVVYDAYDGCYFGGMGGMVYLEAHGQPEIYGVYDAAGNLLGSTIEEAQEYLPPDNALSEKAVTILKKYKA